MLVLSFLLGAGVGSPIRFFKELAPLFYCDCHIFAS